MAYNDTTESPRGVFQVFNLTNQFVTISTTPIKISGIIITESAGGVRENILFTPIAAFSGLNYFTLNIGANETKHFPIKCYLADLKIGATPGVFQVTIFFDNSGASFTPIAVG